MKPTSGTCAAARLTVDALSCVRVLHLPWNTEIHQAFWVAPLWSQPVQQQGFTVFTCAAGHRLANPVLKFVALLTFGTYVAICAQFTIGYAGQTLVVTSVRVESPGAMCPTATLVEETFLSIFVWGGGGRPREEVQKYSLSFLLPTCKCSLDSFFVSSRISAVEVQPWIDI